MNKFAVRAAATKPTSKIDFKNLDEAFKALGFKTNHTKEDDQYLWENKCVSISLDISSQKEAEASVDDLYEGNWGTYTKFSDLSKAVKDLGSKAASSADKKFYDKAHLAIVLLRKILK